MKRYSQYGEETVLDKFFQNKRNGFVVDVGAADGTRYSNSRYLIETLDWSGLLVEPHPVFYEEIEKLYAANNKIRHKNVAVHDICGHMPFYVYGMNNLEPAQVSTLSTTFKDKVVALYGNGYEAKPIDVETITLQKLFEDSEVVGCDFLSVDCEGNDINVLKSNNWNVVRPSLVCVEHSMPQQELDEFMSSKHYKLYTRTTGNSFYISE